MDTQVVIVGAGPVGLMLAGELRLGGVDVVVLERLAEPTVESRASTLHARTMEIFDQRGLLGPLGPASAEPGGHFGGIPLDFSGLTTPFPGQWKVPQARTEKLLADWASSLGARLRRGFEATGLVTSDDQVEVTADGPGGALRLRAEYVVGCDGETSTIRYLHGFDFPGTDASRELLRADVAGITVRNRRFERLPGGLAIAARRPDGVTRVMVHEFGRPAVPHAAQPSFSEVVKTWERVTGEDIGGGTPLWLNAFGNASKLVARYRDGRVLLAGDAAHLQMPAGGQALNLGLQDAANLGWKLAAQVRGDAPAGLLDSYHDERHATGRRVLANIEAQALLLLGGPEVDAVRAVLAELIERPQVRERLASMISGLDVRYGTGTGLEGTRIPHGDVHTSSGTVSVATLLRSGRGLLLGGPYPAAARWAGRVDAVPGSGEPLDGYPGVLVRPDGYVAWAGGAGDDPDSALCEWFGDPA